MSLLLLFVGAGQAAPAEPPPDVGIGGGLARATRISLTHPREHLETREWMLAIENDELAAILSTLFL